MLIVKLLCNKIEEMEGTVDFVYVNYLKQTPFITAAQHGNVNSEKIIWLLW